MQDQMIRSEGAAIVLICDKNYLTPTLAAALSADRHVSTNIPIFIFVVNQDPASSCQSEQFELSEQFEKILTGTSIKIVTCHLPQLAEMARFHRDRYLPPIALARLWLDSLLDPSIDRFLYIDGDTMVDGRLDDLLARLPPLGKIMAVPDVICLFQQEISRGKKHEQAYLEGLGCDADSYFNSGVIYASRDSWNAIAPEALDFLMTYPERCRSSDQSALNHAAHGRVVMLPQTYNYQSDHMMVFDPRKNGFAPIIWHFTGGPKPWDAPMWPPDAPVWPWDEYFNRFYRMAELLLTQCDVAAPSPPEDQLRAGLAHRRRTRNRLSWVYPWRKFTRKKRILQLLGTGSLP